MRKKLILISSILFLQSMVLPQISEFRIPLTLTQKTALTINQRILYFGRAQNATYCIDKNLGEGELPPMPPSFGWEVVFLDTRMPKCLGNGTYVDLRPWLGDLINTTTKDTFLLYIQTDTPDPVKIKWPSTISQYFNSAKIVMQYADSTNMLFKDSMSIAFNYITTLKIYTDTKSEVLPVSLSSFTASWILHGPDRNDIEFKWTTISENNNYGFWIQKINYIEYETIEKSFQAGEQAWLKPKDYCWTDKFTKTPIEMYRLKQQDNNGDVHYYYPTKPLGAGANNDELPTSFKLGNSYPNPFTSATSIQFSIPEQSDVEIAVFDMLGRNIKTLVSKNLTPNIYTIKWNNDASLTSGVYTLRLTANKRLIQTQKIVLIK